MPDQTYQLPRDSTMQGIVTQLQNIASRMSNNGSGGSGGGSTVVANPSGTASDDLTSIEIDGTVYDIPSGSGSSYDDTALVALINSKSTVVANPQGTPDGELTAIEIDGDIYEIVSSGGSGNAVSPSGGSFDTTLLWDYETDNNNAVLYGLSTATLHDDVENYDALIIEVVSTSSDESDSTWRGTCQFYIDINALENAFNENHVLCESVANRSCKYYISGTTLQKTAQATDNTNGLVKVYGIKYGSGSGSDSGGGESFKSESLYKSESTTTANTITLSRPADDYDELRIIIRENSLSNYYYENSFSKALIEQAINDSNIVVGAIFYQTYYAYYSFTSSTELTKVNASNNFYIDEIIGIKYGSDSSSGGTSSEVIPIEAGDGTLSRTFHLDKTPSMVVMSYFEGENDSGWSSQYVLIWGSARAYGTATGTPTSTSGESKTIGITYGADGKSFTINAANAGSALNTTTGHGYLLCFYNEGGGSSSEASGYSITSLYNNDSGLTTVGEITLSGSILDYDDLEFIVGINTNIDHSHQSYRISSKYFYDYFKYGTQHSDDHFMVSPWHDMACGFTLGQNNDPTKINFYDMYTGNSRVNTALYSINGIKYGSGSSAGGTGYSEETLWTGTASLLESSTVNLSKAYTGYDALRFEYNAARGDNNGRLQYYEKTVSKSTLAQEHFVISDFYLWNGAGVNSSGTFTDPTTIVTLHEGSYWFQSCTLTKVVGIKYGSGGNSVLPSGSGYEATLIYDGSALSSLQSSIELDDRWDNYDAIVFAVNFGSNQSKTSLTLYKDMLTANIGKIVGVAGFASVYAGATVNSDKKTFSNIYSGGDIQNIYAVYGLKFGSGGSSGAGGERIVEKIYTATDNTVGVTVETDKPMTDYDYIIVECNEITGGPYINTQIVLKEELQDAIANSKAICPVYLNDGWHAYYYVTDESTLTNKTSVKMYISAVYGVKEGSGGSSVLEPSFEKTLIYEGTDTIGSLQSHITLEDSWDNYDLLEVVAFYAGESTYSDYVSPEALTKAQLMGNDRACALATYGTSSCACWHLNANHKDMDIFGTNSNNIWKIYGIKFGSGGTTTTAGVSSEVIPIEAGDGTSSRTFTFTRKPKLVHVWFTVPDKWSMSEDIFWGQPWGVYNCTNGNAPYSSGAQGSNTITFDDNNLTMTITGVNALGCANNSNGYGYMWVEYGEGSSSGGSSSLAESDKYSTSEKVIGEWIDGRDIYQITIGDETSPVSQQDLSSLNIDFTIDIDGIFGDSNLGLSQCTYTTTASSTTIITTGYVTYSKSTHMLNVVNPNGYVYCVTLKYVKSTD